MGLVELCNDKEEVAKMCSSMQRYRRGFAARAQMLVYIMKHTKGIRDIRWLFQFSNKSLLAYVKRLEGLK